MPHPHPTTLRVARRPLAHDPDRVAVIDGDSGEELIVDTNYGLALIVLGTRWLDEKTRRAAESSRRVREDLKLTGEGR
jgi:hypothetical protein